LSNNQAVGYMVGKELFESMVDRLRQLQPQETFTATFRPSASQLKELAETSATLIASTQEEDLGKFTE
jgi:hypothetical protein